MSRRTQNIDLKALLQNFRDLNNISLDISKELDRKNQILQTGLHDCKTCKMYIDRNKNRRTR